MKKEHGYLIAAVAFYAGAMAVLLSNMNNKAMFGSALALFGIIFSALFVSRRKKE